MEEDIIYIGQTDVTITMTVKDKDTDLAIDLSTALDISFCYKTPGGKKGQLDVDDTNANVGIIVAKNDTINPFDEEGTFPVWLRIKNSNGTVSITTPKDIIVKQPGDD